MQPLDSYREKGFFGVRQFELFDDRIVISRPYTILRTTRVNLPLSNLEPKMEAHRYEEPTRLVGSLLFFLGAASAISWENHPPIYANPGFWICALFTFIGFLLVIRSFFRFEAVMFFTSPGRHRLIIARMGPDTGRFHEFAEHVASQIKLCRSKDLE